MAHIFNERVDPFALSLSKGERKSRMPFMAILFVAAMAFFMPTPFSHAAATAERTSAPDFNLPDLNGKSVKLSSFRGKVIILDFWATWCPPCRAEIPSFKELYAAYHSKGLEVIGIALDQGGAADVARFAKANGINYTLVIGNQSVAQAYGGIRGIPTTFILDRQGRIVQTYVGGHSKKVFEDAIQGLL